jgi:hypothetical protein
LTNKSWPGGILQVDPAGRFYSGGARSRAALIPSRYNLMAVNREVDPAWHNSRALSDS